MNKIDAIRVSTAWTDSETLKNELKVELNSIEYQAILTNIDSYDTTLSYLSGIIWKYYKSYYLTTSTKERCIELLANELSGKLNYYYALINQYKEAYNKNYETIRSSNNTNDRNITTSRTGFNKQATTPETIEAGATYIDNYSTSQQKYQSAGDEIGKNIFKSQISGSSKELWENINAIPKRIYEGIIGLVSKYFFYVYDDDLVPCVELTLEQAIKELNDKVGVLQTQVEANTTNLKSVGSVVNDLQKQQKAMTETISNLDQTITDVNEKTIVNTESIENLVKVTPTDIDYNEGFTLMHDGTPITGQVKKVKLGNNLTYDEANKTINAKGGSSDTAIITLSDNQYQLLSGYNKYITFTTEQAELLKNASSFKLLYNNNEYGRGIVGSFTIEGKIYYGIHMTLGLRAYASRYKISSFTNRIEIKGGFLPEYYLSSMSVNESSSNVSFNFQNNINTSGTATWFCFSKIFGKNILHKDASTTDNIELFRHQMTITKAPIVVYFEFYSSNKLECTSLTHLKTLLGDTFKHTASGSNITNSKSVVFVTETNIGFADGSQEILAEATFEDTVTTI